MELIERVANLESNVALIKFRLDNSATKEDLDSVYVDMLEALNVQPWKRMIFVCGFGTALVAAGDFIAKHVG